MTYIETELRELACGMEERREATKFSEAVWNYYHGGFSGYWIALVIVQWHLENGTKETALEEIKHEIDGSVESHPSKESDENLWWEWEGHIAALKDAYRLVDLFGFHEAKE